MFKASISGFPKRGRIAPKGAILVSWGAKICKGAKGGDFKILGSHNFFYF